VCAYRGVIIEPLPGNALTCHNIYPYTYSFFGNSKLGLPKEGHVFNRMLLNFKMRSKIAYKTKSFHHYALSEGNDLPKTDVKDRSILFKKAINLYNKRR
jgi:hypothetical protein